MIQLLYAEIRLMGEGNNTLKVPKGIFVVLVRTEKSGVLMS